MGAFQGLASKHEFGDYTHLPVKKFGVIKNFFEKMVVLVNDADPEGWRASRNLKVERGDVRYGEELLAWLEQDDEDGVHYALVSKQVADYLVRNQLVEIERLLVWNKGRSLAFTDGQICSLDDLSFRPPNGIERINLFGHEQDISFVH